MDKNIQRDSKFLSLILRHEPEKIGLELDCNGWADVEQLLLRAAAHGKPISRAQLHTIVASSDKQRFALSADGQGIRANQGHSIAGIELDLAPAEPPARLFHGTASRFIDSIGRAGLVPGARNHVHLSLDLDTASKVGARHGKPVILGIRARAMAAQGHVFFLSKNGVWLSTAVPVEFIDFPPGIGF
ncbi:putative RNA 2'-phosphotransferase [Oxalobacteraceae bacterium GrIS 1.11]